MIPFIFPSHLLAEKRIDGCFAHISSLNKRLEALEKVVASTVAATKADEAARGHLHPIGQAFKQASEMRRRHESQKDALTEFDRVKAENERLKAVNAELVSYANRRDKIIEALRHEEAQKSGRTQYQFYR